jgi:hypothetical protein
MNATDIAGIAGWSLLFGLIAFIVIEVNLRDPLKRRVRHWCLSFGAVSGVALALLFLLDQHVGPSKAIVGLAFVGGPALIAGALSTLRSLVFPAKL